ncbi:hypothetical protein [Actinokineospora sp.]|uniref:hypothetical protein n=1 Tax=Actinokineospora sp. TaxID=1872133 RepID=UPI003D6C2B0F
MNGSRAALCVIAGGGAVVAALPASGPVEAAAVAVGATAVLLSVRLPVLGAVAVLAVLVALVAGSGTVGQFAIGGTASAAYVLACHSRPGPGRAGVLLGVLLATGAAVLALTLPIGPSWLVALAPLVATGLFAGAFWFPRADRTP